jgi:YebC/PmpR family DNA-binding regulatory protein
MSGHNKWSKIKHKKALTDSKKSQVFGKLAKLIAEESKRAGGDTSNPALKTAIDKAKAENMPHDNIDRAVKKGAGSDAQSLENITYEAYGPGGSALIIETLTDNRNKAASEIKHILTKAGSALASPGAASWAFVKNPDNTWEAQTPLTLSGEDKERIATLIESLEENDEVQDVYTNVVWE